MNRIILTTGEQFNSTDILKTNKFSYISQARFSQALLGTDTQLYGFDCTPNSPANLGVQVGVGDIYQVAAVDTTPYGDLPVDSTQILKQGTNLASTAFTFTAPSTPGQAVNYLIEIALQESDGVSENRNFFEAAAQVVNTVRQDTAFIKTLQGTPASTGSQTTPDAETGFVPAWIVTVTYGQTQITSGDIVAHPSAPFINFDLKDYITEAQGDARYAQLDEPNTFTKTQTIPALAARVSLNSNQAVPNGDVATKVIYDTEDFDSYNLWNSLTKRYEVNHFGLWEVNAALFASAVPSGAYYFEVYLNGAFYKRLNEIPGTGENITLSGTCMVQVTTANSYIEIFAFNDTTANPIQVGSSSGVSYFEIKYLGSY